MSKIAYEPHPCSPERKAELRAQGFQIVDAVFDPDRKAGTKIAAPTKAAKVVAQVVKVATIESDIIDFDGMDDDELKAYLTSKGADFHHRAGRAKLLEIAQAA